MTLQRFLAVILAMLITFFLLTVLADWVFARRPVRTCAPAHVTGSTRRGWMGDVVHKCSRRQDEGCCSFDDRRCGCAKETEPRHFDELAQRRFQRRVIHLAVRWMLDQRASSLGTAY